MNNSMHIPKSIRIIILTAATNVFAMCQIQVWTCDLMYDCHIDTLPKCATTPTAAANGFTYQEF
jgi:hypothetical protein